MLFPLLAVLVLFHVAFVVALLKKDNSLADIVWGLGFITMAVASLWVTENFSARTLLMLVLVVAWGGRLAFHIASRNHGKGEDYRYKAWRQDWGKWWLVRSYLQVFLLQAVLLMVIAIPVWWVPFLEPESLKLVDLVGVLVWLVGFYFEAVGDWQLVQFKKNGQHKGELMTTGLWKFTRHPNYFGEATMWWGMALIAWQGGLGVFSLISPIVITFLLTKVSGVPMLEKKYQGRPDFEAYKRRTNVFIPWFPRKVAN